MKTIPPVQVTGAILAGGRARRMGGIDKGLAACGGRPLVAHAIDILKPVCGHILINANRHLEDYRRFGWPVIPDREPDFQGPLAGILSALQATATPYLVVVPCDSPRLHSATLPRLLQALVANNADIAMAHDGQRLHPVVMALRTHLADDLTPWLAAGNRKIDRWAERHHWLAVDCSDAPEQFLNINTPKDLEAYDRTER